MTKSRLGLKNIEDYPANSPDLNPLEHVWAYWKDKIRKRAPTTEEQLRVCAFEEWDLIPLDFIKACIESMPKRLEALIAAEGSYTKY